MSALLRIARRLLAEEWWSLLRGTLLAVAVLAAGVALLGLSGWFITAAGVAGLAGAGLVFDVFRPSAGVRFLALGRTAARYGERMLTHDATLKSLARLRVSLLTALSRSPFPRLAALRAGEQLNRILRDVDTLDGLVLRLIIPFAAATLALTGALVALWLLVDPRLAAWVLAGFGTGSIAALVIVALRARRPARLAFSAQNALRLRTMDLIAGRGEWLVAGQTDLRKARVLSAEARLQDANTETDKAERLSGLVMSIAETVVSGGALLIGAWLVIEGVIDPAIAAIGFFATLALAEILGPIRRGLAELGPMTDAARRVTRMLDVPAPLPATPKTRTARADEALVSFDRVSFGYGGERPILDGFSLDLAPGEIVALTGASGAGKSTILMLAAGMLEATRGTIMLGGLPLGEWTDTELRHDVAFLPQRSTLLAGSIRDAIRMADPGIDDGAIWSLLSAVALDETIAARGGLDMRLGEAGSGLSGGESRRLALARTLARRPRLLLLDEPTEGLDRETAHKVLSGIHRQMLENGVILLASHRAAEREFAHRCHHVAAPASV
ncbi:thiol reductant ABC exporter subunit CydC [Pseudohoeflea suaedae]|uniref:Thiol reductant ABC exporter subunit CydC n=1 Tax=Pseudohoeflea suaedae TaxID=877384 RepID=A0A4R5PNV2_9HYPH|nr:thiol reductant ABC exporter subunit CydC [Pseudohoeflea suaedae]TDH38523.1 thiol reductant ABC exporter subunit CydC [Pseudohoeflea suaedae]